ncbi:hypothetical protein [Actinomadura coerulea]|uniref:hypothetical protein n=1 Tax=Actinomadura coerulea TaxID=46159 RepID=UPI00341F04E9
MIRMLISIAVNRSFAGDFRWIGCARCGTTGDDARMRTRTSFTYRGDRLIDALQTPPEWTCRTCGRTGPLEIGELLPNDTLMHCRRTFLCRYSWKAPGSLSPARAATPPSPVLPQAPAGQPDSGRPDPTGTAVGAACRHLRPNSLGAMLFAVLAVAARLDRDYIRDKTWRASRPRPRAATTVAAPRRSTTTCSPSPWPCAPGTFPCPRIAA